MKRRASNLSARIPSTSSSCGGGGNSCNNRRVVFSSSSIGGGTGAGSPDEVDALLVQELNNLSISERQQVLEEVHGVADNILEETDKLVQESLEQLEKELVKIRKKPAYDTAAFMSPSFVQNQDFRLMFLRSEGFKCSLAAQRLVKHFARKLELFGLDRLVRQITQDDLDDDDKIALESGAYQILPVTDQMGRTVTVSYWKHMKVKSHLNQVRTYWYLTMTKIIGDVDTQRKGTVDVLYQVGHRLSNDSTDIKVMTEASQYVEALPSKFAAIHYCYDDAILRPALALIQLAIGKQGRLRFRAHYGSHIECRYALSSFGIPADSLPVENSGNLLLDGHYQYLAEQKSLERKVAEERESRDIIEFPFGRDVVLGRGRPYHVFPGNVQLAILIDQQRSIYQNSNRLEKTAMSNNMVKQVKAWNGRFLKRDETTGGWMHATDEQAREKVSHSFRSKAKKVTTLATATATTSMMDDDGLVFPYESFSNPYATTIAQASDGDDGDDDSWEQRGGTTEEFARKKPRP